jgi:hypothetical protein
MWSRIAAQHSMVSRSITPTTTATCFPRGSKPCAVAGRPSQSDGAAGGKQRLDPLAPAAASLPTGARFPSFRRKTQGSLSGAPGL